MNKQKTSTTKVAKITLGTSFLGIAVCALQFYSMLGVYGMYSTVVHPSPWPWLAFQSCFRLVEISMAFTIAYSVMQPEGASKRKIRNVADGIGVSSRAKPIEKTATIL